MDSSNTTLDHAGQTVTDSVVSADVPPIVAHPTENHLATTKEEIDVQVRDSITHSTSDNGKEYDLDDDDVPETGRWELWAYYLFYNGNNGTVVYSYLPLILQGLATNYGFDPSQQPYGQVPCNQSDATAPCAVSFGPGGSLNVSSMVLLTNGLNFALQVLLFTSIGSLADYKQYGKWILFGVTLVSCAGQMIMLAIDQDYEWGVAMFMSIAIFVTYGASLVFYAAVFPVLAHNMPEIRALRREMRREVRSVFGPKVTPTAAQVENSPTVLELRNKLALEEALERNHISNISTTWSNIGFFLVGIILYGVFRVYDPDGSNPYDANVASFFCGAFWLVCAIPWFIAQRKRPGPSIPSHEKWYFVGWKQVWIALKESKKLRYTFLYIISYFISSDAFNTTGQLITVVQNKVTSFSTPQATAFGLSNAAGSIVGCLSFWYIQKWFKISTKTMLQVCNVCIFLVPLWGCVGIGSTRVGMHTVPEFWAYNTFFGLFNAPVYAYAQTMLSELIPKGKEGQFFGLFGIANRASSFIGPLVISAIIGATDYEWYGK